jgi:beta-lactamase superfamily II metal-dependent hydrolase
MFEIDFLPVGDGNGDAICVRYGNEKEGYWLHVIDGGYADTAKTIIGHIETNFSKDWHINHMVVSHADNDHCTGLVGVIERFEVQHLWMNRPWLYVDEVLDSFHGNYTRDGLIQDMREKHNYLVQLEDLALKRRTPIHEVFQGTKIGPLFTVLAPSRPRYIQLIPDLDKTPTSYAKDAVDTLGLGWLNKAFEAAKQWADERWDIETLSNNPQPSTASNETSVVQLGQIEGKTLLLTADAGPDALTEAADYAATLGLQSYPDFIQVPHHGSRRNVTPRVLDRWLGGRMKTEGATIGRAFCSVGESQPEYPRGQVKNAFIRRGYPVHVTRSTTRTYFHGYNGRGWERSDPEPFDRRVET